ncbi:MAG: ATPase [Alphaproteobacteria bacterium]|nr:ATPase [Alphaproteobacteria bacterium]
MALKRFYREASAESEAAQHHVALDGRPVRTPEKALLILPTRRLAAAIAEEWDAQTDEIRPDSMPMTQLASTAIDRVRPRREEIVDSIAAYAGTDLLCYRADGPSALVERQAAHWQPLLDWAALQFDAPLSVTDGIVPVEQPADAVASIRRAVADGDEFTYAGLYNLTVACGSVVMALAVREGEIDAAQACHASQLDESWQAEQWGEDPEAAARQERIRGDIHAATRFLDLLKG